MFFCEATSKPVSVLWQSIAMLDRIILIFLAAGVTQYLPW
jgi:hypothetical protein